MAEPTSEGSSSSSKWHQSVLFVLLMLFLVLGPLGLPLLWKSPRFSTLWKILLTAAVLIFTVWLISLCYSTIRTGLNQALPQY